MTGNNPEPRTEAGTRLLNDVREVVVHGVTDRIRPGFDLAWHVARGIAAIEAEATAAAEQRLRERIEALVSVRFGGGPALLHRAEVLGLLEPQAALASDPASPSEPAIPLHQGAAAPRQGEPVDGLDVAWRAVEDALPDGWDGPRMLPIGTRGSVSRWVASAIAHSAAARGNRAWIVDGSGPTPAEALQALTAALSEPAEAGEP